VIDPPASAAAEDAVVKDVCLSRGWAVHQPVWLAAYGHYRVDRGNPFRVPKAIFHPDIGDALYGLYDSRGGGPAIRGVRGTRELPCCAMCGSGHNGTVDHFLPRDDWPEFSIMSSNLVPACSLCNSGAKGTKVTGAAPPERFLHPYFDRMARKPLWQVKVDLSTGAPAFIPLPVSTLSTKRKARVSFHIGNLLRGQFYLSVETHWGRLPSVLRVATGMAPTAAAFKAELRREYRRTRLSTGVNSWRTALLRGVIGDPVASLDLLSRV
jgi:5-methylcytosine-specific restriction endonuclease McrA